MGAQRTSQNMASHRIRASITTNNSALPRCKSEGTLIDLSESVSEASLNDVKGVLQQTVAMDFTNLFSFVKPIQLECSFYVWGFPCYKNSPKIVVGVSVGDRQTDRQMTLL